MLPSSVRRVVVAPQTTGVVSSITSSAPWATGSVFRHQRRNSSSKPSKSDNGSSSLPAGQSVTAAAPTRAAGNKATGDKRKRKTSGSSAANALPSVPTTHHMVGSALGLSSFFSLHRPISITQTVPHTVTDGQFASIFAPRNKASKVSDTMATLSSTIDQLEGPMASVSIDPNQESDDLHKMDLKHPDGTESSIYLRVDAMSGDFLPFRPPPTPQPQPNADSEASIEAHDATDLQTQHRVYRAIFTIEETTEADGEVRIVAHSPRVVEDSPRDRMTQRRRGMYAISVKRQRKLRMKKKKYKKLMRRTRNERRKLDRT